MKRKFKSLLAVVGLAFIGLGSLLTATSAQAVVENGNSITQNGVTCTPRINGNYPDDGRFYYCGDPALPDSHKYGFGPSLQAIPSAYTKAQMSSQNTNILVFCTEREFELYFGLAPTFPDADLRQIASFYEPNSNQLVLFQYLISRGQSCATPTGALAANKIAVYNNAYNNMRHEIGHFVDDKISVPASTAKNSQLKTSPGGITTLYGKYINADIAFFNNRLLRTPCTNSFFTSSTRDVFINAAGVLTPVCAGTTLNAELSGKTNFEILQKISPYYFSEYEAPLNNRREQFSETFPISLALTGSQPAGSAANFYLTNHFSCAKAYTRARANTGLAPVKADFDAYINPNDPDPNFRCNSYVAPFVPASCAFASKTGFNYPYRPGYDQYVYCGDTGLTYTTIAGDVLVNLPNSAGSSFLRDKFQQSNITLYVFKSAADAQAKLGAANIPAAALQPGILGWTQTNPQPEPVSGVTPNKFIAVWERYTPWGSPVGTLVSMETTPAASDSTPNRFRSAVSQQAGRTTDALSGSLNLGGTNTPVSQRTVFSTTAFTKDRTTFDAKATCTVFIAPVCVGGVVQAPYTGQTNWQILTTLYPDVAGTPSINTNQYLFAEQVPIIAFSTAGTANGGTRKPMDDRLFHFNNCTKLYTETVYKFWRLPTTPELTAASCQ